MPAPGAPPSLESVARGHIPRVGRRRNLPTAHGASTKEHYAPHWPHRGRLFETTVFRLGPLPLPPLQVCSSFPGPTPSPRAWMLRQTPEGQVPPQTQVRIAEVAQKDHARMLSRRCVCTHAVIELRRCESEALHSKSRTHGPSLGNDTCVVAERKRRQTGKWPP